MIGVLHGPGERPIGIDLSPDGRTLAVLDEGGDLTFVDTVTRRAVGPSYPALDHEHLGAGTFDDVRFSPDGSRVAVGGSAPAIVDARSHRLLAGLRPASSPRLLSALLAGRAHGVRVFRPTARRPAVDPTLRRATRRPARVPRFARAPAARREPYGHERRAAARDDF